VKEISEINKKINVGQGGSSPGTGARPAQSTLPPGTMRGLAGLGMVNTLAPHMQKGG